MSKTKSRMTFRDISKPKILLEIVQNSISVYHFYVKNLSSKIYPFIKSNDMVSIREYVYTPEVQQPTSLTLPYAIPGDYMQVYDLIENSLSPNELEYEQFCNSIQMASSNLYIIPYSKKEILKTFMDSQYSPSVSYVINDYLVNSKHIFYEKEYAIYTPHGPNLDYEAFSKTLISYTKSVQDLMKQDVDYFAEMAEYYATENAKTQVENAHLREQNYIATQHTWR